MLILSLLPRKFKLFWQRRCLAVSDSLRDGKAVRATSPLGKRWWLWIGLGALAVLLLWVGNFDASSTFAQRASESRTSMQISLSVLGVDPLRGELETRLEFDSLHKGSLGEDGLPNQNLIFFINSVDKQGSEIRFSAGRSMDAIAARFNLFDGSPDYYPFDRYLAEISFNMEIENPDRDDVPLKVVYSDRIPGYELEFIDQNGGEDRIGINYEVRIRRSLPVLMFICFIMLMMWIVSCLAMLIALMYWRTGRVPEPTTLGLMATLLFAFPAIRNAQPGVPPVGTLGDFLSFFWAESLVIIALAITWVCFLRRYNNPKP
jgi:Domain of unknown function (DUF4436)